MDKLVMVKYYNFVKQNRNCLLNNNFKFYIS